MFMHKHKSKDTLKPVWMSVALSQTDQETIEYNQKDTEFWR